MLLQRSFVCCTLILASLSGRHCSAQNAPGGNAAPDPSLAETVQQLQEQVKELRSIVSDLRSESEQYRAETRQLREELHTAVAQMPPANKPEATQVAQTASATPDQEASNPPARNLLRRADSRRSRNSTIC